MNIVPVTATAKEIAAIIGELLLEITICLIFGALLVAAPIALRIALKALQVL